MTLIIFFFRALEILLLSVPSLSKGEKVGANVILAFRPAPPFFLLIFFFTSISNYSFWHVSSVLTASHRKSNYLPFLLAFRHIVSTLGTKRFYHLLYLLFSGNNLPFLISLFIAFHFQEIRMKRSTNLIYKTIH